MTTAAMRNETKVDSQEVPGLFCSFRKFYKHNLGKILTIISTANDMRKLRQ